MAEAFELAAVVVLCALVMWAAWALGSLWRRPPPGRRGRRR